MDWLVAPLDAFGRGDVVRAGGKGANLGELIRAGYRVPAGFVVTTDAYAAVLEGSGLTSRISARLQEGAPDDTGVSAGSAIRAEFADVEVPGDVRAAITDAYAALGRGPVAVRSSATAEDLPGAAFAGQHDTYLNIVGEAEVLAAVRRCWASLWTDRAIAYRRQRGIDAPDMRIAVIVQDMVDADTAGVLFTANPLTGDASEMVINASYGLGCAVVDGRVSPDSLRIDKATRVPRDRILGDKSLRTMLDPADDFWISDPTVEGWRTYTIGLTDFVETSAILAPAVYPTLIRGTHGEGMTLLYQYRFFADTGRLAAERLPATVAALRRLCEAWRLCRATPRHVTVAACGDMPAQEGEGNQDRRAGHDPG